MVRHVGLCGDGLQRTRPLIKVTVLRGLHAMAQTPALHEAPWPQALGTNGGAYLSMNNKKQPQTSRAQFTRHYRPDDQQAFSESHANQCHAQQKKPSQPATPAARAQARERLPSTSVPALWEAAGTTNRSSGLSVSEVVLHVHNRSRTRARSKH